jgi:hypothetical protein
MDMWFAVSSISTPGLFQTPLSSLDIFHLTGLGSFGLH